ncbi:YrdB family protein [Kitasatospora mediocidica]|uniref:YrdB family protein n=1 Tax=Kitasatospora mediocidica TaxID=58352 RepID=UPI0018DC0F98|nr:YrdB family protein [Kitasatospora mediocidica]
MADDLLAFLLELAVYAVAVRFGLTRRVARPGRWALALVLLVGYVVVWAVFGAPGATVPLHGVARAALDLVWFGSAAVLLWAMSLRRTAVVFVVAYLLTTVVHLML